MLKSGSNLFKSYHFSHKIQRSFSCNPNSVIIITTERRRDLFAHLIFSLVYRWSNSANEAKSKQENERKEYTNRRWLAIYRSHCSLSPSRCNRCCATRLDNCMMASLTTCEFAWNEEEKRFEGKLGSPGNAGEEVGGQREIFVSFVASL